MYSIGRSANSKLSITHEDVSYHHALIVYQSVSLLLIIISLFVIFIYICNLLLMKLKIFFEPVFWLRDVGSKNGTFLNGVRLSEPRVASAKEQVLIINELIK